MTTATTIGDETFSSSATSGSNRWNGFRKEQSLKLISLVEGSNDEQIKTSNNGSMNGYAEYEESLRFHGDDSFVSNAGDPEEENDPLCSSPESLNHIARPCRRNQLPFHKQQHQQIHQYQSFQDSFRLDDLVDEQQNSHHHYHGSTKTVGVRRTSKNSDEAMFDDSFKIRANQFVLECPGELELHYDVGDHIGEGGYGDVYQCIHKESGAERAVKVVTKSEIPQENEKVISEFNILKTLDHPNILKNFALYQNEDCFYIVTDLYKGGELFDLLCGGGFSEHDAAVLIKHILLCINYCHKQGIVHRDLKPENILLEENQDYKDLKIIDFGLAARTKDLSARFNTMTGSIYYLSPQVLQRSYGYKTDVYSCGVILYMVLAGFAPFDGDTEDEIVERIMEGEICFGDPVFDHVSDDCLDFIEYLLTYDEENRPSAEEALQHRWLERATANQSEEEESQKRDFARLSLTSLTNFSAETKLKQAVCSLIASQLLSKHEKEEIDSVFRALDLDVDGRLSRDDVMGGYKEYFGVKLSEEKLRSIFKSVNFSSSGYIEYSEFVCSTMMEKNLVTDDKLETAFQMLDREKKGYISFDNMYHALGIEEGTMESYVTQKIIEPVDLDGDGRISMDEFIHMMSDNREQIAEMTVQPPFNRRSLVKRSTQRPSFRTSFKMPKPQSSSLKSLSSVPSKSLSIDLDEEMLAFVQSMDQTKPIRRSLKTPSSEQPVDEGDDHLQLIAPTFQKLLKTVRQRLEEDHTSYTTDSYGGSSAFLFEDSSHKIDV